MGRLVGRESGYGSSYWGGTVGMFGGELVG